MIEAVVVGLVFVLSGEDRKTRQFFVLIKN